MTRMCRVALLPVPGGDQPGDDVADLGGGDRDVIVIGAQADRVQDRGPRRAARLQRRDDRVGPARDHLRLALPPPIDMAEQPVRAGRRAGPQPAAHIHRQHQPPIRRPRQRQPRQRTGAAARRRSGRGSPRHTARRDHAGAPGPATAPPGPAPARPRTAPHPPARTSHPCGRSGRHETPAGTATARRLAPRAHPLASCPSRPSLVIMVLWREHMIMRRPYSRTATRRDHRQRPPKHPGHSQAG